MITMQKPTVTVVHPKEIERCKLCPPGVACLWVCAPGVETSEIVQKLSESFSRLMFYEHDACPYRDVAIGEPSTPSLEIWDYPGKDWDG